MKKLLVLMLVTALMLGFTACDKTPKEPEVPSTPGENVTVPQEDESGRTYDGYSEHEVGQKVSTAFFDFTVNSVEKMDEYKGIKPNEGNVFVLANISVTNTFKGETPMYSDDFQVQWGGTGDDDYGYTYMDETGSLGLVADEVVLKENDGMIADYLFQVPADSSRCSISYLEIYEDGFSGNVFFVYFAI